MNDVIDEIKQLIPDERRNYNEAFELLKKFFDFEPCTTDEVDDGMLLTIKLNSEPKGITENKIQAYKIINGRSDFKLEDQCGFFIFDPNAEEFDSDSDLINTVFLLLLGYKAEFGLGKDDIDRCNNRLITDLKAYLT